MEKTYSIELTELEAKVLKAMWGSTCGGPSKESIGSIIYSISEKLRDVDYNVFMGGNYEVSMAVEALSLLPHGQGVKKQASVLLNDNYTATLTSESIVVGCQTFPLSIIDELVAAREKLND